MRKLSFLLILFTCLSCSQVDKEKKLNKHQPDSISTAKPQSVQTKNDPVSYIREKVTHINTVSLKKKHVEFVCDVNTKVDFFYENGAIVKISIDFGTLGDVYAREDYYYDKNKLIFFYEFVEGGPACEGCIEKHEYRSYIQDDKVFKYLKDKDVATCRKCEFGPSSRQYKLLTAKNEEDIRKIVCKF